MMRHRLSPFGETTGELLIGILQLNPKQVYANFLQDEKLNCLKLISLTGAKLHRRTKGRPNI